MCRCVPSQNDQWRNSGGASGATELPSKYGVVVRRYGVVRRRSRGDKLRYHEYSFKKKGRGVQIRIFHTLPSGRPSRSNEEQYH